MKVILKEEILRLNCPGFGEQSYLTRGQAKSLDEYKAIFVNPLSILHLFDRDADSLKAIDTAIADGLTAYSLPNDDLVNALNDDITERTEELVRFLEKGGLLVYFLCRPFVLQGSSFALDNYVWLLSLAPVKSSDKNVRQMSTVATGRNVEPCPEAANSEFADYFRQEGLEWNTVIRAEFLTDGYSPLATAGLKKCIAGELYAGDNGGRIVFLPAPYSPDFDRTLIQCTNLWYQKLQGLEPDRTQIAEAVANLLSPPRPEQKPALLRPSSSLENAPGLAKSPATTSVSGNGALKPTSQNMPAAKPVVPSGLMNPLNKPQPSLLTSGSNLPKVPSQTSGAAGSTRSQGTPLVRGEAAPALTKSAATAGGTVAKSASPLERKPTPESVSQAPAEPAAATELTTTADHARPDLQPPEEEAPPPANEADTTAEETVAAVITVQDASPVMEVSEPAISEAEKLAQQKALQDKIATTTQSRAESLVRELEQAANKPASSEQKLEITPPEIKVEPKLETTASLPALPEGAPKKPELATTTGEWFGQYSISGLEDLRRERASLIDQTKQLQARLLSVENRVTSLTHMKNTMLGGGPDLLDCCVKALASLGWQSQQSPTEPDEIWLSAGEKPEALARVIRTLNQPTRSDLAQLAESIITFWGEHEVEPKGVMIACAWADTPLSGRTETAFPDALIEFAKKKNICLITTLQILCAYKDIEFGKASPEDVRKAILGTSGSLDGLKLDMLKVTRS